MFFQNDEVRRLVPDGPHDIHSVRRIAEVLTARGTLHFVPLASGLYPASPGGGTAAASGYANVWVRDNVYVAYAHCVTGRRAQTRGTLDALLTFFERSRSRFDDIIEGRADPDDVSRRPHIRFNGETLTEITEPWAHAENDALGYFLWLFAEATRAGVVSADHRAWSVLTRLVAYFAAIAYWEDEDSGHWEEARKVSASSIGTVVAGLRAFERLSAQMGAENRQPDATRVKGLDDLIARGEGALRSILPAECRQLAPAQNRRYDAALLPLVYPLGVVTGDLADLILHDITRYLLGPYGIRRYLGDSYWAPDYDAHLSERDRTRDFSDDVTERDALLPYVGQEAQWCLFDPLLSAHYGRRYRETGDRGAYAQQERHFNRALAQITPAWQCAELYYCKDGRWVTNPHVPLLWTQANLLLALNAMQASMTAPLTPYSASPRQSR